MASTGYGQVRFKKRNSDIPLSNRFDTAISRIDAANAEDPRTELVDGSPQPKELVFARLVYEWVERLTPSPSEAVLLAARAHTLRRWMIPRDRYPETRTGYHEWREALAQFHAQEAEKILQEVGYPVDEVGAVKKLITRETFPEREDARLLEDADCLAFLEAKLAGYVDDWGAAKTVRILKRTMRKMSDTAKGIALGLSLGKRERDLILQAAGMEPADGSESDRA